jgi:methoxymalonate biosynthesis acyl carrier protein
MNIENRVKNFLQRYIGDKEIGADDEIFSSGLVNSLFAMQLVLFLEKEFNLEIGNQDLNLDNFKTLNSITDFVKAKQAV